MGTDKWQIGVRVRSGARAALACAIALVVLAIGASSAAAAGGALPMYLHDLGRSDYFSSESAINTGTASTLKRNWSVKAGGPVSTQAVSANGLLYYGSWNGVEHAANPTTGRDVWHTQLGSETKDDCFPKHIGVASSAAIATVSIHGKATSVDFVGGGAGSYYALNARTGKVIWSHFFGSPQQGWFMWSSPAFYKGSVYVGVASIGDCPLVPGELVKFNAATGAIQSSFAVVPRGCVGGGVWGSPAIDERTGDVFDATGNDSGNCNGQIEPYAQAVVQLSSNLSLRSYWRIPASQTIGDSDFGAGPTLFTAKIGGATRQMVGVANKNGLYYAFIRGHLANGPVWETGTITTNQGEVASSAFDGKRLYVAGSDTVIGGRQCQGSFRAVNPSNGAFIWSKCLRGGLNYAALAATPGTVWGTVGSFLYGLRSSDGKVLFSYQQASGAYFYAPAMFSGSSLFIGSPDGSFMKFTPAPRRKHRSRR